MEPTFDVLEKTLYAVIKTALGPWSVPLMKTYPAETTLPQLPRNTDVVFFDVVTDRAPDPVYTEFFPHELTGARARVLPLALKLIFYGPSAKEIAYGFLLRFYADTGPECPRALLRRQHIYPAGSPPEPLILHEPEGTLWRLRADLTLPFRTKISIPATEPLVTAPPAIQTIPNTPEKR